MKTYTDDHLDVLDDYIESESDQHSNLFNEVWARIPEKMRLKIMEEIEQTYGITAEELLEERSELEELDDDFLPFEEED